MIAAEVTNTLQWYLARNRRTEQVSHGLNNGQQQPKYWDVMINCTACHLHDIYQLICVHFSSLGTRVFRS